MKKRIKLPDGKTYWWSGINLIVKKCNKDHWYIVETDKKRINTYCPECELTELRK